MAIKSKPNTPKTNAIKYTNKNGNIKLDDITDSMAIAICHAHSAKFAGPIK